ncbi:MAG: hypothetical protein AABY22_34520 [Nanoarchaeota archaeon]
MYHSHYTKLFRDPENIKKAIFMLNSGYTYNSIALVLGCDHTTVMAFRKRMIKSGMKFEIFKRTPSKTKKIIATDIFDGEKFKKLEIDNIILQKVRRKRFRKYGDLKISQGKSYQEYLKEDMKKNKKIRDEMMAKAKVTINKIMEYRKEHGIVYQYDL